MKWLVDIDRAVAEGLVSADAGGRLKSRAREEAAGFGIGVLTVGGILLVMLGIAALSSGPWDIMLAGGAVALAGVGGVLSLGPSYRLPANAAAVIGIASAAGAAIALAVEEAGGPAPAIWIGLGLAIAGLALRLAGPRRLASVAAWSSVFGGGAHLAGLAAEGTEILPAPLFWLDAAALSLAAGVVLDLRILSALAVFALAGTVSATGYAHAAYMLAVFEPSLLILAMTAAIAAAAFAAKALAERWARHGRIVGLIAFVWINLAFWVGSLWGDRVGEYSFAASPEGERATAEIRETLLLIPEDAFAIVWAVLIVAVGVWAAATGRRSAMNAAATFGAIHAYTQWFERFSASPESAILVGIATIGAAWGLWKLNAMIGARDP